MHAFVHDAGPSNYHEGALLIAVSGSGSGSPYHGPMVPYQCFIQWSHTIDSLFIPRSYHDALQGEPVRVVIAGDEQPSSSLAVLQLAVWLWPFGSLAVWRCGHGCLAHCRKQPDNADYTQSEVHGQNMHTYSLR
jgi:hypothetical protein